MKDGTAESEAELILLVGRNRTVRIVEEILGIELFVAQELVRAAVKVVCPRLDGGIDDGAVTASEFGAVGVGLDLKFLDRLY